MPSRAGETPGRDERDRDLAELHLARTDLQAIVQGSFMEELLGMPRIASELDRIDGVIDELAARPASEVPDKAIPAERDRQVDQLVAVLLVPWPWFPAQLRIGLWWRSQLVAAEQRRAASVGEAAPASSTPGWPPKWTGDRRALAVGGGPWAVGDWELAPRLAMRRGDSLEALQQRWREISDRVDFIFRSSMFSTLTDDGPPGGAARDDAIAYDRYARWAARRMIGGESYRAIAIKDLALTSPNHDEAVLAGERWREVKRGVRKAIAILDSV